MTPSLMLVLGVGVLVATGVHLLMERSLTRVLLGILLLSNGVNLLLLVVSGPAGEPAFIGTADESTFADPLPQAMVLTAIVITLGMTAFLLAMAHRSWQLRGDDEVQDDVEDRTITLRAIRNETSGTDDLEPGMVDEGLLDDGPGGRDEDHAASPSADGGGR